MKKFNSFQEFSNYLESSFKKYKRNEPKVLNFLGVYLGNKMIDTFGILQKGYGNFPSWAPLKPSTIADKIRGGYVYNSQYNPLVRTGELKNSIDYKVSPKKLRVGSKSEIMIFHEFGTSKMAQRSVIGLTMFKQEKFIKNTFTKYFFTLFENKDLAGGLK